MDNITDGANGSGTDGVTVRDMNPESIVVPIIFLNIFVLGVVGNTFLLFIVCRHRKMRTVPNMYLVNLAIGDLLLICTSVPFDATIYTFKEWSFGEPVCKLGQFMNKLCVCVSVLTLTLLSEERFYAIVWPKRYTKRNNALLLILKIGGTWCAGIMLGSLSAVSANLWTIPQTNTSSLHICIPFQESWGEVYPKVYTVLNFCLLFAVPVIIIAIYYFTLTFIILSKKRKNNEVQDINGVTLTDMRYGHSEIDPLQANGSTDMLGSGQVRVHADVRDLETTPEVVLCLVALFIICWLPRHIYLLWFYLDPSLYNIHWHGFKIVGFCLKYLNSCVNPFALYVINRRFRYYFKKHLFCNCCGTLAN